MAACRLLRRGAPLAAGDLPSGPAADRLRVSLGGRPVGAWY